MGPIWGRRVGPVDLAIRDASRSGPLNACSTSVDSMYCPFNVRLICFIPYQCLFLKDNDRVCITYFMRFFKLL